MSSNGALSVFLWDICRSILLSHLWVGLQTSSEQSIYQKFTSSFLSRSGISSSEVTADSLCSQTGPQGSSFLTSPVGWKLKKKKKWKKTDKKTFQSKLQIKYVCYIITTLYLLGFDKFISLVTIFLRETGWNQRTLKLKIIKGNVL